MDALDQRLDEILQDLRQGQWDRLTPGDAEFLASSVARLLRGLAAAEILITSLANLVEKARGLVKVGGMEVALQQVRLWSAEGLTERPQPAVSLRHEYR